MTVRKKKPINLNDLEFEYFIHLPFPIQMGTLKITGFVVKK